MVKVVPLRKIKPRTSSVAEKFLSRSKGIYLCGARARVVLVRGSARALTSQTLSRNRTRAGRTRRLDPACAASRARASRRRATRTAPRGSRLATCDTHIRRSRKTISKVHRARHVSERVASRASESARDERKEISPKRTKTRRDSNLSRTKKARLPC